MKDVKKSVLHKNLYYAIHSILKNIFNNNAYADREIEKVFKQNKKWGSRDRGIVADTIYSIVRYKRLYFALAKVSADFVNSVDNPALGDLEIHNILTAWALVNELEFPSWWAVNLSRASVLKVADDLNKVRVYRESVPDWLDGLMVESLGVLKWEAELVAMNTPARTIIRANSLKTSVIGLKKELERLGINSRLLSGYPFALELAEKVNIFKTGLFKEGYFEVQDASSQLVASSLDLQPRHRVIDCCAGAGGKTLHMSALMENKGKILATDVSEYKLEELSRRARRNGCYNIRTKIINDNLLRRYENSFDRLLLDAPCSGLGVIKRNPDAKWKMTRQRVLNLIAEQEKILSSYPRMLRRGGKMVYATCSILREENEMQIDKFLTTSLGREFELLSTMQIYSHVSGYDGFFIAVLERK